MTRYVALLRGINVGGNNVIRMTDLRDRFEALGFGRVSTYIQSGNVLFDAPRRSAASLAAEIEDALSTSFAYRASVVLRTGPQLRRIVDGAPAGFGEDPTTFRSDVLFLKPPLRADQALSALSLREGVDRAWPGDGVVYADRLAARASQSRLSKVVSTPIYGSITIRNWNTTVALAGLL